MNTMHAKVVALLAGMALGALVGRAQTGEEGLRFEFREPRQRAYRLESPQVAALARSLAGNADAASDQADWLRAWPDNGSENYIEICSRVLLQCETAERLAAVLAGSPTQVTREIRPGFVVLQAGSPLAAAAEAARLAGLEGVLVSHPVQRRRIALHSGYAPRPNDPYLTRAWHLENRNPVTAEAQGFDLNVRAAWTETRGEDVVVAVADEGVEITHPDLSANGGNLFHYNFHSSVRDGRPASSQASHGTAVTGLIAAAGENFRGASGVAPAAMFASWVIFNSFGSFIDEQAAMDMFQYESQSVGVQNHSWGNSSLEQLPLLADESVGIENAVTLGRDGRGVVMVRAAGNERAGFNDTNDDGYAQDPRAIAVGAVRANGRVAGYSTPGATVLVSAFSGDDQVELPDGSLIDHPSLFTTDRTGSLGYNKDLFGESPDYTFDNSLPTGTSFSTPQISGLCALLISANPGLTYRDVQQILVLSAQPLDWADPDLRRNSAGLWFSHNTGYGVPDAGVAVRMAKTWTQRPGRTSATVTSTSSRQIPDDGLRVEVSGLRLPADLESIPAFPIDGLHPDDPTSSLTLVDVGQALAPLKDDLTGKAALIQRGQNYFVQKLNHAAAAGAAFAVIYNNTGGTERIVPNGADIHLTPIPAVFIDQDKGTALANQVRLYPGTKGKLSLDKVEYALPINDPLICEHVRLRVRTSHARRADVRITLVSPSGTRSVLQRKNRDTLSPLSEWDYYSAAHFFEPSRGEWRAEFSDEAPGVNGRVLLVELTVFGVPIADVDADGLDDDWERRWFGSLAWRGWDDNDGDGASNAREQALGTNPAETVASGHVEFTRWDDRIARLSWPGLNNQTYRVRVFDALGQTPVVDEDVPGRFPEAVWFGPAGAGSQRFFSVERMPAP